MKITARTVSAILFTLIAIAAFTWMVLRPNVNAQIAGFAMPVTSAKASTSGEVIAPSLSTDATTKEQSIDKIETNSAAETSAETAAPTDADGTVPLEIAPQEEQKNSETVDTEAPMESMNDKPNKDEKSNDSTSSEEPEAQEVADPEPVTLEDNKIEEYKAEQQLVEKKKTDSESSGDIVDKNTLSDTLEPSALSTTSKKSETTGNPTVENLTSEELNAENASAVDEALKEVSLANSKPADSTLTPQVIATPQTFIGNNTESTRYTLSKKARGTVVILHGCNYQADVEDSIVQTLHNNLPSAGWNTLSFQLPALKNSSNYQDLAIVMPDVAKGIESNITMAKEKSQTPVVLLAHGCGSHMALAWMEVKGNDAIDAYIGIGTGIMNTSIKDIAHLRKPLENMKFPQLDVFGSADNEAVLKTAPERLGHINRAANPASRQKIIANADHNMTGKTEQLSKTVIKWLNKKAFTTNTL